MKNECSMFRAHCNDRNLEGYRTLDDSSSIPASHSLLEQLHLIPWLTQMPPVTPEDEEGACHSEAEAGDIFSCKHKHQIKGPVITIDHLFLPTIYCLLMIQLLRQVGPPERAVNSWK